MCNLDKVYDMSIFLLILEREITFQMPFTLYRAAGCYGQYSATTYK